ncbi:hypothetical protein GP721_20780 [Enterobacteriaceae bacterium TzEc077]|uniref:hypothetical protein n=1 Tax=Escherichia coli TaxID=562 RepID=UPI001302E117|nr:hypothetical protein [Escherichia coli]KAE9700887.1 hypothetical protein GP721_20780 [Enterobacteriaceae bacterium TzEc077]EES0916522.1 hypothetical protein [Escherichia coli]KAE9674039.1 hypothetical protein GP720_21735 [Escherichia coli]KAE9776922.1 hypothetical protein GP660_25115 [Escherichia coli]MBS9700486.1 hypothetical protein [Escherichia coli]
MYTKIKYMIKGNIILILTLFMIAAILVTDIGVAGELNTKVNTESEEAALKILSVDMNNHTNALKKHANRVSNSVILSVKQMQSVQQKKLFLQMKIDEIRSQMGGVTDLSKRNVLNQKINQLEKERANIRVKK